MAWIPAIYVVISLQILGVMYMLGALKGDKPIITYYLGASLSRAPTPACAYTACFYVLGSQLLSSRLLVLCGLDFL